ncbi:MAG: sodium:solute symporter [Bacteroidota bacterium]
MSAIDWWVLFVTLFSIVSYGIYKSRNNKNIDSFLLADKQLPWYHVGFSVMATQASAITFLSAPGQAYSDGLRFIQFYFGLPLAMIVICTSFIPIFRNLNVYTAYEYLEKRFDTKTRLLTAFLFLLQRGLSTGITIYAPSIVLSTILDLNINYTTVIIGCLVISYTVFGGTKAVSYTQLFQMIIIFSGLILAAVIVVYMLPPNIGFIDSLRIAGKLNKLNAIDTSFDWNNRYNIWSGIIGGFFLQLSYFGTDQSQVGRYLTGKSTAQSRLGLLMNGLIKIPMQFFILMIGILVFAFFQFHTPPVFFNESELNNLKANKNYSVEIKSIETQFEKISTEKKEIVLNLVNAIDKNNAKEINEHTTQLVIKNKESDEVRTKSKELIKKNNPRAHTNDSNYIFLNFVINYFPKGLIGLLIAIIFLASMGSTASGLNSLASTTVVDFYKRLIDSKSNQKQELLLSRISTAAWGFFCIVVALFAAKLGNLIEAVNILGSLFYGTILGIFLSAFFIKKIKGTSVFIAAIITEIIIFFIWYFEAAAFLWLNVLGCFMVIVIAVILELIGDKKLNS